MDSIIKVNWQHYCDVQLSQQMLAITSLAGQSPANRANQTMQLLQRETPDFTATDLMWPPNNQDLNPDQLTTRFEASCSSVCVRESHQ